MITSRIRPVVWRRLLRRRESLRHVLAIAGWCATVIVAAGGVTGEAHKPITSPYTFNEDVLPIVRARCGACHVAGGIAPMSLMTAQDAVPWGESIRAELIAGHMPPWNVESAAGRFHHPAALSARELNVILTWVTGGTPIGNSDTPSVPAAAAAGWALGAPDLALPLPAEFSLGADRQEATQEFTIDTAFDTARWLRAVDLRPGNPAIVREAVIAIKAPRPPRGTVAAEHVLALWVPGNAVVPLDAGTAYRLAPGAQVIARIHYRKTWQNERLTMADRSTIGLYFAAGPASELGAISLDAPEPPAAVDRVMFTQAITEDLQALAIYPDESLVQAHVRVEAVRPDGSREELLAFRPQPHWVQRYWFAQPIALPRGSIVEVSAAFNEPPLLPPGATPIASLPRAARHVRLTLNVTRAARAR